jgi:hypothetical protein
MHTSYLAGILHFAIDEVLIYETRSPGKELVGFVEVDNWDQVADALAARGHDRGACFHLPELNE